MMGFEGLTSLSGAAGPWGLVWMWAFKSAVILAAALLLCRLLVRATAALRHRVWAVAFSLVLLLPVAELALPGVPLLPDLRPSSARSEAGSPVLGVERGLRVASEPQGSAPATEAWDRRDRTPPNAADLRGVGTVSGQGRVVSSVATGGPVHLVQAAGAAGRPDLPPSVRVPPQALGVQPAGATVARVPPGPDAPPPSMSTAALVGGFWLMGLFGWLTSLAVGLRRAQRGFQTGWEPHGRILRYGQQVSRDLGLKRPVPIRVGTVDVPATWGWRRPRVLLPLDAEQWSADRVHRVLVHELAHVKRRDWPLTLVAEVARALHWYNPLAWAGLARMRVERERACDDVVLNGGSRASDYAMDLLDVARGAGGAFAVAPVMALGRKQGLAGRIEDLLDTDRRRVETRHAPWVSAGILSLVFGFLALLTVAAGGAPAEDADGSSHLEAEPPEVVVTSRSAAGGLGRVDLPRGTGALPNAARVGPEASGPRGLVSASSFGTESASEPGGEAGRLSVEAFDPGRPPHGVFSSAPMEREPFNGVVQALRDIQEAVPLCNWDRGSGRGRSMQTNVDDDGDWKIHWRTPECETEIWLEGDVVFNDTEDGVASMGRDARFEVRERQDGVRRRLVAQPDGGTIRYRFWLDGDEADFDAAARRWFRAFLPELFRQTTLQAEARVARLFDRGGAEAVLAEVRRMDSDHVAARYLELLMTQEGFEPTEVPQVLDVVAERMDSDHYVATILEAVGDRWGVRPEYEESYLRAVDQLESDHYAHGALLSMVRDGMSDGVAADILAASRLIESDHYKADLLTRMARADGIGSTDRAAYLEAFASVESDHYQHSIVMALLDSGSPEPDELVQLLALLETVESDHYRADVLTRIGRDHPLSGAGVGAFLRAAHGIESDHYASEVGRVLVGRADLESEQIDLVLDIARGIGGDHGRAELMRALIREHPLSAGQRDRFRQLALGIESRHLQDQLLAELVR